MQRGREGLELHPLYAMGTTLAGAHVRWGVWGPVGGPSFVLHSWSVSPFPFAMCCLCCGSGAHIPGYPHCCAGRVGLGRSLVRRRQRSAGKSAARARGSKVRATKEGARPKTVDNGWLIVDD